MTPIEPVGEGTPFGIGGQPWPGLAKLAEECGELLQVLGKIIAYPDTAVHPDGTLLNERIMEELGDVRAAMIFFAEQNGISKASIHARAEYKLARFRYWDERIRS